MAGGRTIKIYLDEGTVSGIKHSEIVNWTGQAISVPRHLIKNLKNWDESKKPGVYFLFGSDENDDSLVYIGESENILERLGEHLKDRGQNFFNEVIFFTSKDLNLTKAHVKYLESRLIEITKEANRYTLKNKQDSSISSLPRGDVDAMEEYINYIRILTGTLSHKVLEPISKLKQEIKEKEVQFNTFYINSKNIKATIEKNEEGFVVLKGSLASKIDSENMSINYKNQKEKLKSKKILIEKDDLYEFSQNYLFNSSSQLSSIIVGYSVNGRTLLKLKDKKTTLKDVEENEASEILKLF